MLDVKELDIEEIELRSSGDCGVNFGWNENDLPLTSLGKAMRRRMWLERARADVVVYRPQVGNDNEKAFNCC